MGIERKTVETEDDIYLENVHLEHKSFGLCAISRVSGHGLRLFGSDVTHDSWLELRVKQASFERHLNTDWYHAEDSIVEIRLSHSQFSEMVSNMNCGEGVPCTITDIGNERIEQAPFVDRRKQYSKDFENDIVRVAQNMDELICAIDELKNKPTVSKKDKEALLSKAKGIRQDIASDMPFVKRQFDECLDNAVSDAKRNIEGHALNVALSAARKGLVTHDESSILIDKSKEQKFLEE